MGHQLLPLDELLSTKKVLIQPLRVMYEKTMREIVYFNRCFLKYISKKEKYPNGNLISLKLK
jgi:hypothetical protein